MASENQKKQDFTVILHTLEKVSPPESHDNEEETELFGYNWFNVVMAHRLLNSVENVYKEEKSGLKKDSLERLTLPTAEEFSVGARKALLQKYGLVNADNNDAEEINLVWKNCVSRCNKGNGEAIPENDDKTTSKKDDKMVKLHGYQPSADQLMELLSTSKSNGRNLTLAIMAMPPGMKFKLHAHPNIELIYCMDGALHEVRMTGSPPKLDFPLSTKPAQAPDLSGRKADWFFNTLSQGNWMVNDVGSVHRSFTSANMGTQLFVMWSEHANVTEEHEPKNINISFAVEEMDRRVSSKDGCCGPVSLVGDEFLPPSEKN